MTATACVFGVNGFEVKFTDSEVELVDYNGNVYKVGDGATDDGEYVDSYALGEDRNKTSKDVKLIKKVAANLTKLTDVLREADDVLETTFGDGVKVVATCKGFDIDDYEHD